MARGFKTGGRTKGTPNRATTDVQATLAALECDPIEGMARIAMDVTNTPELRGRMFAELAGYVAPKRKAIEHTGDLTTSILGAPTIDYRKLSDNTLDRLYDAYQAAQDEHKALLRNGE